MLLGGNMSALLHRISRLMFIQPSLNQRVFLWWQHLI